MDWTRIAQVGGIVLAGLGGALIVLGILNGGSGPLAVVGIACAAVGWGLRLWVKSAPDREARRRLRD
jgi:hypothetical protein